MKIHILTCIIFALCIQLGYSADNKTAALPKGTHKVIAYLFNPIGDSPEQIIDPAGKLHGGILSKYTKVLQENDIVLLLDGLTETKSDGGMPLPACEPIYHHGIVFYNADEEVISSISICFQCSQLISPLYKKSGEAAQSHWDWVLLHKLFNDNKFPIYKDNIQYSKLKTDG